MLWKWLRASCTPPDCFCSQYINTLLIKACLRNTDWTGAWGRLLGGDHCWGWGTLAIFLLCSGVNAELQNSCCLTLVITMMGPGRCQLIWVLHKLYMLSLCPDQPSAGQTMAPGAGWAERGQGTFCRCNDFMLISIVMITVTLATTVWPLPRDVMLHLLLCCYIQCLHDSISGDDRRELGWGLLFARYKYKWWQFAWNAANPPIFRRSRLASPGPAPARVTKYPLKVGTSSFISR